MKTKKKIKLSALIVSMLWNSLVYCQSTAQKQCEVFPNSSIPVQESTPMSFTEDYAPSGSSWWVSFEETHVYQSLLKYDHPTNNDLSYELRIGKGGQIYSFISVSGETVPPQYRNPNQSIYGGDRAPWVDDVWQIVAVDSDLNDPDNHAKYFIHQAGVYLLDPDNITEPFYSPQIASYYNAANQEYTTVNWGQQAHIEDNITAGHTSALLYYAKYKNLGEGIIQVDYMLYNFGEDRINHTNFPWGGIRKSTYENFFVSNTDNSFTHTERSFGDSGINFEETNGWVGFSENEVGDKPSLGLVVNNTDGVLRIGDAGTITHRNYTVYSGIKNGLDIDFGKAYRVRNYFILDSSMDNIQAKIANLNLQANTFADYDPISFDQANNIAVEFESDGDEITFSEVTSNTALVVQLQPYANSYPLFIIEGVNENDEAETRITSDLYTFSDLPYDGKATSVKLVGFSDTKKEVALETDIVTYGGSYTFPDGNTVNNIIAETVYFSDLGEDANGYDQGVQTKLTVTLNNVLSNGNVWYHNYDTDEFNASIEATTGELLVEGDAVSSPSTTGNSSSLVAKFTKDAGVHSNIRFSLPAEITAENQETAIFKIKMYIPSNSTSTNNNVKAIIRKDNTGSTQIALTKTVTLFDQWQEFTFDFSGVTLKETSYNSISLFFAQPDTDVDATGNVYYFDAFQGPSEANLSIDGDVVAKNPVQFYPNPARDSFSISEKITALNIYNILGQNVKSFNQNQETYAISELPNGIYTIKVVIENNVTDTFRLIKK